MPGGEPLKPGPQNREEYVARINRAWQLACDGYTGDEIADEIGCGESTVYEYLKEARKAYAPVDAPTEQQLWLKRWDKQYSKVMRNIEACNGDEEKLLEQARKLQRDRAWFLGLNAAKKLDISHTNGNEDDEVDEELEEALEKLRERAKRKARKRDD